MPKLAVQPASEQPPVNSPSTEKTDRLSLNLIKLKQRAAHTRFEGIKFRGLFDARQSAGNVGFSDNRLNGFIQLITLGGGNKTCVQLCRRERRDGIA